LNTAGLGDLNFAALIPSGPRVIKRGFAKGLTGIANDREQHEIAALDGSEHPEWTAGMLQMARPARLDLMPCSNAANASSDAAASPERAESFMCLSFADSKLAGL